MQTHSACGVLLFVQAFMNNVDPQHAPADSQTMDLVASAFVDALADHLVEKEKLNLLQQTTQSGLMGWVKGLLPQPDVVIAKPFSTTRKKEPTGEYTNPSALSSPASADELDGFQSQPRSGYVAFPSRLH
jgi:hypothetical protein